MKFKEHDTVRVLRTSEKDVNIGDMGVIVMVFNNPEEAYEVEVMDEEGYTKTQCTLLPADLEIWKVYYGDYGSHIEGEYIP